VRAQTLGLRAGRRLTSDDWAGDVLAGQSLDVTTNCGTSAGAADRAPENLADPKKTSLPEKKLGEAEIDRAAGEPGALKADVGVGEVGEAEVSICSRPCSRLDGMRRRAPEVTNMLHGKPAARRPGPGSLPGSRSITTAGIPPAT
jgi:hypothetical protein